MSPKEIQITLIAPYKGIDANAFQQIARDLHCRLRFVDLVFEDAIDTARNLSPDTCDVVLSRGATVDAIKKKSRLV